MRDQYNRLFEDVHLSEAAKEKLIGTEEKQSHAGIRWGKGRLGIKAAVLVGIVFLGSTGIYAAKQMPKSSEKQPVKKWQVQVEKSRAEMSVNANKLEENEKDSLYDVKLTYLRGYKQDKEYTYLYRKGGKDENGVFSVILYHLNTDYKTLRTAQVLEKFETEKGQGYMTGADTSKHYISMFMYDNVNYMVQINGSNMSKEEVRKITEGAVLYKVSKKKDIKASYIEWTKELQKRNDAYIKKMKKREK